MELLSLICPDNNCEQWLLLIIGEIIDLIVTEVKKGEDYETLWRHSNTFSDFLCSWGEDRSSTGLFAAIGLGKEISTVCEYFNFIVFLNMFVFFTLVRLLCKCISTFMRSQLISPGFFCSINEHKREMISDNDRYVVF
ncbi:hypothetical protein Anas_14339 [Armadillidium nasatum]|uniref:Uncharacterized protein n=1 Tax=Armadillidium nasatum TaxID=96803 RepID=A0A5N5SJJ5_9CRUS|nr:hypothetical protein Anas_14339 [Armadillidium nasatum]